MAGPITTTTEQDELILRFLRAVEQRVRHHPGRIPFNEPQGNLVLGWARNLVGKIDDDGNTVA